uniref:Family with sequence similarity 83 member B n=1 Tax=Latimeria chalumnae TaxID=7897 RepID=H3AQJ9_LATCH
MESLSHLSSLTGEFKLEEYVEPHYKEWYRLAIDALVEGGIPAYEEFLVKEDAPGFLSEEEINYIINHIEKPLSVNTPYISEDSYDDTSSSGTYWPVESDVEAPNLDLGWPNAMPGLLSSTNIDLFFHPPRGTGPTIKEIVRKLIKEARQVIAIVMDMFTDVDIFRETLEVASRGVPVYILLDDTNFSHFLSMSEKQGVQIQRMRSMRVRTVKGQDYFCKSGTKFYGSMAQKFLMVDCQTVVYGSFSFMWSFEKINLSMVQVISGKLVESFDEEFRTLFARSSIPSVFAPEEQEVNKNRSIWKNGSYNHSVGSFVSTSSQVNPFDRKQKLRHTLDSMYFRAQGRQANPINNMKTKDNDTYSSRFMPFRAQHTTGLHVPGRIQQLQAYEKTDFLKRHSYAGEMAETSPYLLLNKTTNLRPYMASSAWNVRGDADGIRSSLHEHSQLSYSGNPRSIIGPDGRTQISNRNTDLRKTFHGADNQIRALQKRMPTLEQTTKTFLRSCRIESYLNDHSESPVDTFGEPLDYQFTQRMDADRHEGLDHIQANPPYSQSRLRSSFVFNSSVPQQREFGSCNTNSSTSTLVDHWNGIATTGCSVNYSTNSRHAVAPGMMSQVVATGIESSTIKRRSLQILDDHKTALDYNTAKQSSNYPYSTLGRIRKIDDLKSQQDGSYDIQRHTFQLPDNSTSKLDYRSHKEAPNYLHDAPGRNTVKQMDILSQKNEAYAQTRHSLQYLDGQRSDWEYNAKREPAANWNAPPSRTVSTTSLVESNVQENNTQWLKENKRESSSRFLKAGSQKIKSFLNLTQDKKENLSKTKSISVYKMCGSSDTLVSDENVRKNTSSKNELLHNKGPDTEKSQQKLSWNKGSLNSMKSENKYFYNTGDSSAPRFNTEQLQYQDLKEGKQSAALSTTSLTAKEKPETDRPKPENTKGKQEGLTRPHVGENRVYSRFEGFCNVESTNQKPSNTEKTKLPSSAVKNKSLVNDIFKTSSGHSFHRHNSTVFQTHAHNENKFGKIMQRFGNFIHKKK